MPSPFPGMDPYLEAPAPWGGVHARLIVAVADQLNLVLPDGYRTNIEEYVWLQDEEDSEPFARRKPDVFVPEPGGTRRRPRGSATATPLAEPTAEVVLLPGRSRRRRRVVIRTAGGHRVVTVLEILSPANKMPGKDRNAYLAKRDECLASGTNLVEIDLLRDGDRLPLGKPRPTVADYYLLRSPADRRPRTSVWAFGVRDPIPVIGVPLRPGVGPVPLDLRACLDRVYDDGFYGEELDYRQPADPPLDSHDAEWAATLFAKPAKKRGK